MAKEPIAPSRAGQRTAGTSPSPKPSGLKHVDFYLKTGGPKKDPWEQRAFLDSLVPKEAGDGGPLTPHDYSYQQGRLTASKHRL
jgi:hypothetical protein